MTYGALFFIALAIILALSIFVSWWFLLGIIILIAAKVPVMLRRARLLEVLAREYGYEFPPTAPQAYTLNRMERDTRRERRSDPEVATLFMAAMCNSLSGDGEDVRSFCLRALSNAERLRDGGTISEKTFQEIEAVVTQKRDAP